MDKKPHPIEAFDPTVQEVIGKILSERKDLLSKLALNETHAHAPSDPHYASLDQVQANTAKLIDAHQKVLRKLAQ